MSTATGPTSFFSCAISSLASLTAQPYPPGDPSFQCRPVRAGPQHKSPSEPFQLTRDDLGNTVYIGLGLAAPNESKRWIKSSVPLVSFCVGYFCFSRFHRYFSPSRRWVLCMSFLMQMTLIIVAASILTWGPKADDAGNDITWNVLVPIALVAFQSCGQAVTSRALKYNALTSVVLTSI